MQRLAQRYKHPVVLAVNETRAFRVLPALEAIGQIDFIMLECKQRDGTWIGYIVYERGVGTWDAYATPGVGNLRLEGGVGSAIFVTNIGGAGDIFCRLVDDTGKEIMNVTQFVAAGETVLFPLFGGPGVTFDMPNREYVLTVEVGH